MVGYRYTSSEYDVFEVPKNVRLTENQEDSGWRCTLFGGKDGAVPTIEWRPAKGQVPNWFHRKMQELCFGFKWRKTK